MIVACVLVVTLISIPAQILFETSSVVYGLAAIALFVLLLRLSMLVYLRRAQRPFSPRS
jgi:hypothetical protein